MSTREAAKPAAAKGMAGMVVGDTSVGYVDGAEGILEYRGYDIRVLAETAPSRKCRICCGMGGCPGSGAPGMKAQARACRFLPQEVIAALRIMPKNADPMAVMRTAVSMLGHYDPESEENSPVAHQHKACRLLGESRSWWPRPAPAPRRGPIKPRMDLDHAANFLWMLTGEDPEPLSAKRWPKPAAAGRTRAERFHLHSARHRFHRLRAALGDHRRAGRAERPSARRGCARARCSSSTSARRTTSNLVRKGPSRGPSRDGHRPSGVQGAGSAGRGADEERGDDGRCDRRTAVVRYRQQAGSRRHAGPVFQRSQPGRKRDFYSAPLLYSIGIPVDAFTCMFAMSRIVGWTAHVYEQQADNRLIRRWATTPDSTSCRGRHGAAQVGERGGDARR